MKTKLIPHLLTLIVLFTGPVAHSQSSGTHGGDINELTEFTGRNGEHLDSWYLVKKDLLKGFLMGRHRSLSLNGNAPDELALKVIEAMNTAKVNWDNVPVQVNGVPRSCENFTVQGEMRIHCNETAYTQAMLNADAEAQYRFIAHEYLSVSGFEPNAYGLSDYWLSSQISKSLQNEFVKRWAVNARPTPLQQSYHFAGQKKSASIELTSSVDGRWSYAHVYYAAIFRDNGNFVANETISIPLPKDLDQNYRVWANLHGRAGSVVYKIILDGVVVKEGTVNFEADGILVQPFIFDLELLYRR